MKIFVKIVQIFFLLILYICLKIVIIFILSHNLTPYAS